MSKFFYKKIFSYKYKLFLYFKSNLYNKFHTFLKFIKFLYNPFILNLKMALLVKSNFLNLKSSEEDSFFFEKNLWICFILNLFFLLLYFLRGLVFF